MGRKQAGGLELAVMLAVQALGDGAYGVAIRDELNRRTGVDHSFGAIYTTLDRLADKGLLGSRLGEATAQRGGRAKRYFRLSDDGRLALARAIAARHALDALLPAGVADHG